MLRFLRLELVFCVVFLMVAPARAATDNAIVVLMEHTVGPAAWTAAERRLVAELRGLQMQVKVAASVQQLDEDLPERVVKAGAFVGIQVLRDGDRGIVRFWFAPQRGQRSGYQHVEINLRNADVVSTAVLPVVEAIFDRTKTSMQVGETLEAEVRVTVDACSRVGHGMCDAPFALRLGGGAFLVHADSGATTGLALGLRYRLWSATRLELEAAYLFHGKPALEEELHDQKLLRSHLMFEAWGKDGRGAAIGPGVGLMHASGVDGSFWLPTVGARAAVFAPISRAVNLVFTLSGARMVDARLGYTGSPWLADALLSVDWYVGQ